MSEKMTCPGCDSHTSAVLRAYEEGGPCPYCGLSADAITELRSARLRSQEQKVQERMRELVVENSRLTTRVAVLEHALHRAVADHREQGDALQDVLDGKKIETPW